MSDALLVAIVSGLLTLAGTVMTIWAANRKTQRTYETSQAVIEEKVSTLTAEVRRHNDFASRIPVLEERLASLTRRLDALEKE